MYLYDIMNTIKSKIYNIKSSTKQTINNLINNMKSQTKQTINTGNNLINNMKSLTNETINTGNKLINLVISYRTSIRRSIFFIKFGIPLMGLFSLGLFTYTKLRPPNQTVIIIKNKDL